MDNTENEFLVTDQWPGGSKQIYDSGIYPQVDSIFMGAMTYFPDVNSIKSPAFHRGGHDYTIIQ